MSSLYLGKIGGASGSYEIHALTQNLPFREFGVSEIGDQSLFQEILRERFRLLASGKPIYCTAVHPDVTAGIEQNPHDTREGTVHIVSLDAQGWLACSLSVAVDTDEKDGGAPIGLPLENTWKQNGYPAGASLTPFRERYLRLNYRLNRRIRPYEMAELYRHFRAVSASRNDIASRIGLYTGVGHLFVREAIKKGKTPSFLWVFDAIPAYFTLYKWVGGGMLRDPLVDDTPCCLSPAPRHLKQGIVNGSNVLTFRGRPVSRAVRVPVPRTKDGALSFEDKELSFLDGLVDCRKIEIDAIGKSPISLSGIGIEGMTAADRINLRVGLTMAAKRSFALLHPHNPLSNFINRLIVKKYCAGVWDFNHIGHLSEEDQRRYRYDL